MNNLTLAIADYDRVSALADGRVKPEGFDLDVQTLAPSETFYRMLKEDAFDISEMSLSSFLIAREQGKEWTAIPVFPYRTAFHVNVYVNETAGIVDPGDLAGKRFGLTEYQVTAALWARGVLQHEFGLDLREVEWFVERSQALSHGGETGFVPPPGIRITEIGPDDTLAAMVVDGRLDAVLPSPYPRMASRLNRTDEAELARTPGVARLFPDPAAEVDRFFDKYGYLHLNHTVVIQNRVLHELPDLPQRLMAAFTQAKDLAYDGLERLRKSSLVSGALLVEAQRRRYGDDPFPYGLAANRNALEALVGYSADQGLIASAPPVEELFGESTRDT
ncbi:MAG: hypothetical protein GEU96_15690 [Propionibacteriales bacterium]|nr:hypothetical protein [Propionibacteriales bacterium]